MKPVGRLWFWFRLCRFHFQGYPGGVARDLLKLLRACLEVVPDIHRGRLFGLPPRAQAEEQFTHKPVAHTACRAEEKAHLVGIEQFAKLFGPARVGDIHHQIQPLGYFAVVILQGTGKRVESGSAQVFPPGSQICQQFVARQLICWLAGVFLRIAQGAHVVEGGALGKPRNGQVVNHSVNCLLKGRPASLVGFGL